MRDAERTVERAGDVEYVVIDQQTYDALMADLSSARHLVERLLEAPRCTIAWPEYRPRGLSYEVLRWPNGITCPFCGGADIHDLPERREWQCNECRRQFSATTETALHGTRLPAETWIRAAALVREKVSTLALGKEVGVNWRTARRIRETLESGRDDPIVRRMWNVALEAA